jgi:hypothetical protein
LEELGSQKNSETSKELQLYEERERLKQREEAAQRKI